MKFDLLSNQIEEIFEKNRAKIPGLSDIEILKKVLYGYHAAYSSSASLQLSLKTMHYSFSKIQSAVILPKQVFKIKFTSKVWHRKFCKIENFLYE